MRRFWATTGVILVVLGGAFALTLSAPLGLDLWHYNVAFAVLAAGGVVAWARLRKRRFATVAMAWTGVPATVTGFAMLLTKDFPYKDPLTWWHSVTSAAFLVVFLAHWVNNKTRLWEFTVRLFTRDRVFGLLAAAGWLAVLAHIARTAVLRESFTRENYLSISLWTIVVGVAFAYGLWLVYRLPRLQARLRDDAHRNRVRALVDTGLFLANWGALLTGFALVWFAGPLRAGSFKYVSKWWHTATSVAFLAFVALHVGFNARLLAAHARRVDEDLAARSP